MSISLVCILWESEQAVECVSNGNNNGEDEDKTIQDKRPRNKDDAAKEKETTTFSM